ncbi:hypothetical protein LXL04_036170 [Taraxacum kok-saghyz]
MDPHFFDGIDENLGMPPSEDNNAEREIPESTPSGPRYSQRIRQPAAVLLSPNTTIASTPPVKKNRKKDKIVVSTIEENLGRPLLETYIEQEARPKDARWRVVPTTLMRVDQDDDWSAICEGIDNARNAGVSGPPWWTVDRLFVPINIPDLHWFMAEVNLKTWKVTIYDSMKGAFRRFGEGGQFSAFATNLKKILENTSYWDHFPKEKRRNDIMSFVEGENVPQQTGYSPCNTRVYNSK